MLYFVRTEKIDVTPKVLMHEFPFVFTDHDHCKWVDFRSMIEDEISLADRPLLGAVFSALAQSNK